MSTAASPAPGSSPAPSSRSGLAPHHRPDRRGRARSPGPAGGAQPEVEEPRHHAAGAASLRADGDELARRLVALHEQHLDDAQGAAALEALERADELALEPRARGEPVHDELHGGVGRALVPGVLGGSSTGEAAQAVPAPARSSRSASSWASVPRG